MTCVNSAAGGQPRKNPIIIGLLCSVSLSSLVAHQSSFATAEEINLPTIFVVEARRVDEDIVDVPASVSATAVDTLTEGAPDAASNVATRIPNYAVQHTDWPRANFGAIRGVGTLNFPLNTVDTTIGYSQDGQPVSLYGAYQQLLDVERVEVVRGPQNTLFGRGSQGGHVNYVTRKPDGQRDVRIRGEVDTDGAFVSDVILGGQIVDGINGRLALRAAGQDGFIRNNLIGKDLGESDILAGRGSLHFQISPQTSITTSASYENDERNSARFILRGGPGFPLSGLDEEPKNDREIARGTLELKHLFENFDFAATATLQDIMVRSRFDTVDGVIYGVLAPALPANIPRTNFNAYEQEERVYTGEVRFTSKENADVRWIAGANIYSSTFDQSNRDTSTLIPTVNGRSDTRLLLTTTSVFGEVGIPIAPRWTLTPSIRVGYDNFKYRNAYNSQGAIVPVPIFNERDKRTEFWWAGGATLDYKITDDGLLYASLKRGHSAGGFPLFNANAPLGVSQVTYPESVSLSVEGGAKQSFHDGQAFVSASVFYNNVKDGHLFDLDLATFQFVIAPQDYETYGFEIEGYVKPDAATKIFGGIGFTKTKLRVSGANTPGARDGGRVPGVPDIMFNFGVQRIWDLEGHGLPGELLTSADVQYVGDRDADIENSFDLKSYAVVNALLGWQNEKIKVYAYGRNLTNQLAELAGGVLGGTVQTVTIGRGRQVGFGGEVRF